MKKCKNCGCELADDIMFCSICGTKISENEDSLLNEKEVIHQLVFLYNEHKKLEADYNRIYNEPCPYTKPNEPILKKIETIPYPPIKPANLPPLQKTEWNTIREIVIPICLILLSFVIIVILGFFSNALVKVCLLLIGIGSLTGGIILICMAGSKHSKEQEKYNEEHKKIYQQACEKIKNSSEYKTQCESIRQKNEIAQAKAEEQFKKQQEWYENAIADYASRSAAWQSDHFNKCETAKAAIETNLNAIDHIYVKSKIVPLDYRDHVSISHIAQIIDSSNYSVKEAIELYDRRRQRELTEQHIITQQQAVEQSAIQNELLAEQNDIADQARRDSNRAAIIGAIQQHNANRYMKNFTNAYTKKH